LSDLGLNGSGKSPRKNGLTTSKHASTVQLYMHWSVKTEKPPNCNQGRMLFSEMYGIFIV